MVVNHDWPWSCVYLWPWWTMFYDHGCLCHLTKHGQPWSAVVIKHGRPWSKTHTRPWLTMVDNHGRPRLFMPFNKTMVDHALYLLDRGRPWFLHPCFHDRCQNTVDHVLNTNDCSQWTSSTVFWQRKLNGVDHELYIDRSNYRCQFVVKCNWPWLNTKDHDFMVNLKAGMLDCGWPWWRDDGKTW